MKKFLRFLLCFALLVAVAVPAVVLLFARTGIPDSVIRDFLRKIEIKQGVRISVDSARWTALQRIAVQGVRFSVPGSIAGGNFESAIIDIEPEGAGWLPRRVTRCRLKRGRVELGKTGEPTSPLLHLVDCDLPALPEEPIRLRLDATLLEGWRVTADGTIRQSRAPERQNAVPVKTSERISNWAGEAHRLLRAIEQNRANGLLPATLTARSVFSVDPVDPGDNKAWAFVDAGPVRIGGFLLDRCSAAVRWTDGQLQVSGLQARSPDGLVAVDHSEGTYSNGLLHIGNLSVNIADPDSCLPTEARDSLNRLGFTELGRLRFDVALGPAAFGSILSNVTGRVRCERARYRGDEIEGVEAAFLYSGQKLQILGARAALCVDGPPRTVTLQGAFMPEGAYRIGLKTDAEPQRLAAFLPTNIAAHLISCDVRGYSRTEATLSRGQSEPRGHAVNARIQATDVVRNEVPVDLICASIAYSNSTLRVEDLSIVRDEGQMTGRMKYDFTGRQLTLNGRSTIQPKALARFFGPALEAVLVPCRVEGPVTITGNGRMGLQGNSSRDLRIQVDGEQIGYRWFLADRANFDLVLTDQAVGIEGISAGWCKGRLSGSLRFEEPSSTNAPRICRGELGLEGADLAGVIDLFRDLEDRKAYEGILSGSAKLSGNTGADFLSSATGSGRIEVRDGAILSLPLLGGLSKYLSLLIPGLGYANQRDFKCTFEAKDGKFQTNDAQLLGKLLTVRGTGCYAVNGDVSFRVQVQLLKEGLTATVTRLITSPLTKALEFELTGTTKEPRWRPINTPDRLLKFFNEKLGTVMPVRRQTVPPAVEAP